jgi:hypothetical protein
MLYKVFISLGLSLFMLGISAQVPEYTHHVSRSFLIGDNMTVDISNKYGKIQIIPWEKDSVKFSIDMRIRARDRQKLEKLKQSVDFEFTTGQYYVLARTAFGDKSSDVFKDIVDIAGSYLSSSNSVTINYTVRVPAQVALKIENKFGDVFLDDLKGSLNLILSYGNLKANRLEGRSDIKITSGDGDIGYLHDGLLFISYGNLHVVEATRLTAQTRSSNVTLDKTDYLKLDSRRDKLYLHDTRSLSGAGYFSDIHMATLREDLNFSGRYGDLTIVNVLRTFTQIHLTSEFTDLFLTFERPLACSFDLTHHQDVQFMYPKAIGSLKTKVTDAPNKIFSTAGTLGTGRTDAELIIKASRKCAVTISQQ